VDKSSNGSNDLQTVADRAAQFCIEHSLQQQFDNQLTIIGEEDKTSAVPNLELSLCEDVLLLDRKCEGELRCATAKDFVIWVDPLDGTSVYAEGAKTNSREYYNFV
jgi:3'-phosphoadenosine 5'-phosphosulfate (PAPS) 3'-phosphatase